MPQLRKRKTKEIVSEEIGEKVREESPVISKSTVKKKKVTATPKTRVRSKTKIKRNDTPVCSEDELFDAPSETKPRSSTKKKTNGSINGTGDESFDGPSSKTKTKSSTKRKTNDNSVCKESTAKKTAIENCLSPKKDSKIGKVVSCVNIKDKVNDMEYLRNSIDSGISSETSKEEIKFDVAEKSQSSTSSAVGNKSKNDDSSSSESEWEEVDDGCETNSLDDYKPDIPKEGVEITIDCPELRIRKRKKKEFDENEWIRLHINRIRKDIQLSIHKTHLLCLLAHGIYINKMLNCDSFKALALSLIPDDISSCTSGKKIDKIDITGIEKIVLWFRDTFTFENEKGLFLNFFSSMVKGFASKKAMNASEYNLMFIIIARILGFKVRMCVSLYPVTYKASNLIQKPNGKRSSKKSKCDEVKEKTENKSEAVEKQKKTKVKKQSVVPKRPKEKKQRKEPKRKIEEERVESNSRPRRSTGKSYKISSDEADSDSNDKDFELFDGNNSDDDFQKPLKDSSKVKHKATVKGGKSNRKILSSDSEPSSPQSCALEAGNIICWAEIFSKPDKHWIAIECANNIINKPYKIEILLPKPVAYIVAYDNNSYVKDVTRRYCNDYMTATIKLRIDPDWWEETLDPFLPPNTHIDKAEEKKLDEMLVNKPLPKTISEFKNHPLYALKRHLLKFEAIYPPDAPPVGFIRSEPVYARDCVHKLHSRETWLKEARVVRVGEQPYKIVKARPKWDRIAGVMRTDLPLEVFGHWQTEQYEPPTAVGGKVPRNEYGNVELFKPCMLPKGTVHLQLPGLNRVAKKLGIDCSPAVVGFDGHKGSVHAVFDGFIVCKEFKDTLIAAWDEEQENARKREEEKRESRIYGNWKKLIKGLLIRERIKLKYDTK